MIKLNNLSKFFVTNNNKVIALDNINLHVQKGTIFGVIGVSGAGKSTLIRCVNLLEKPTTGEIIIDGKNLTELTAQQLRRSRQDIGMIFQHFNLLSSRTVYKNISLPLELNGKITTQQEQHINELLEITNLTDKKNSYPAELSGGQKQRVAIARALVNNPKVLLCDEATSALDPQTTKSILNLLQKINKKFNLTILLITHEMDVVQKICTNVALIEKGKIIEENTPEKFFLEPKTELAKKFVRIACHEKTIPELNLSFASATPSENNHNPLIRITFNENVVDSPVITKLAKKFNVDFNIIQADVETVHNKTIGFLIVKLLGNTDDVQQALNYLQTSSNNINYEVISYAN